MSYGLEVKKLIVLSLSALLLGLTVFCTPKALAREGNYQAHLEKAEWLLRRKRLEPAAESARQALTIAEIKFATKTDKIVKPLSVLANIYEKQGELVAAQAAYERLLKTMYPDWVVGAPPALAPDSLYYWEQLGHAYKWQRNFKSAIHIYEAILAYRETELRQTGTELLDTQWNLFFLYKLKGDYSKAEAMSLHIFNQMNSQFWEGHPATAKPMKQLANIYFAQGREAEGEELFQKAVEVENAWKTRPTKAIDKTAIVIKKDGWLVTEYEFEGETTTPAVP